VDGPAERGELLGVGELGAQRRGQRAPVEPGQCRPERVLDVLPGAVPRLPGAVERGGGRPRDARGPGRARPPDQRRVEGGARRVEALVQDLIGRVADKWTMIVLEVLGERGRLRFTQLGALVGGISQKMLTQTLRQMERDGLLTRTVHPVVPPRVEYELTPLGLSLGAAFCGVWVWAAKHLTAVERARASFDVAAGR